MTPLFPLDPDVLQVSLSYFEKVSGVVSSLVAVTFIGRSLFCHLLISGPGAYAEIIKDTLTYFLLVLMFPKLFFLTNTMIGDLAYSLYWEPRSHSFGAIHEALELIRENGFYLKFFTELAPMVVTHLAQAVSTMLIGILVGVGPIVIFMNTMLGIGAGAAAYMSALLSLMLWPVLWNMLGSLANELETNSANPTTLMRMTFWVSVYCIQIASPIFSYVLFSSLAPGRSVQTSVQKMMLVGRLVRRIS